MSTKDNTFTGTNDLRRPLFTDKKKTDKRKSNLDKKGKKDVRISNAPSFMRSVYDSVCSAFPFSVPFFSSDASVKESKEFEQKREAEEWKVSDLEFTIDVKPVDTELGTDRQYETGAELFLERVDAFKERLGEAQKRLLDQRENAGELCKEAIRDIRSNVFGLFDDFISLGSIRYDCDSKSVFLLDENKYASFISSILTYTKQLFLQLEGAHSEKKINDAFKLFHDRVDSELKTMCIAIKQEKVEIYIANAMAEAFRSSGLRRKEIKDKDDYNRVVIGVLVFLRSYVQGLRYAEQNPEILDEVIRFLFKNIMENTDGFFAAIAPGFCPKDVDLVGRKNAIAKSVSTKELDTRNMRKEVVFIHEYLYSLNNQWDRNIRPCCDFIATTTRQFKGFLSESSDSNYITTIDQLKEMSNAFLERIKEVTKIGLNETHRSQEAYLDNSAGIRFLKTHIIKKPVAIPAPRFSASGAVADDESCCHRLEDVIGNLHRKIKCVLLGYQSLKSGLGNLEDAFKKINREGVLHEEISKVVDLINLFEEEFIKHLEEHTSDFTLYEAGVRRRFFENSRRDARKIFNAISSDKMHFDTSEFVRNTNNSSPCLEAEVNKVAYLLSKPSEGKYDFDRNKAAFLSFLKESIKFVDEERMGLRSEEPHITK